jgi:hypothetical protein
MGQLWPDNIVTPEKVIEKIKPGMSIFIGMVTRSLAPWSGP